MRLFCLVLTVLCLAGCGHDSPTPAPTPVTPPPTVPPPPPAPPPPTFSGQWVGTYRITRCTDSGQMATQADLCGTLNSIFGQGGRSAQDPLPVRFLLNQNGTTVTGRFELGNVVFGERSGTVQSDGTLTLTSDAGVDPLRLQVTWTIRTPQSGILTGGHQQVWTHGSFDGQGVVTADILEVSRVSGG